MSELAELLEEGKELRLHIKPGGGGGGKGGGGEAGPSSEGVKEEGGEDGGEAMEVDEDGEVKKEEEEEGEEEEEMGNSNKKKGGRGRGRGGRKKEEEEEKAAVAISAGDGCDGERGLNEFKQAVAAYNELSALLTAGEGWKARAEAVMTNEKVPIGRDEGTGGGGEGPGYRVRGGGDAHIDGKGGGELAELGGEPCQEGRAA